MKTMITACAVFDGVVQGTLQVTTLKGFVSASDLKDAIGITVIRAMDETRRQGWHMGAPNAFIRVELKEHTS